MKLGGLGVLAVKNLNMKTKMIIWRGAVGKKVLALMDWLRAQGSVAIGFSGGVDSTFLAAVAQLALGMRAGGDD